VRCGEAAKRRSASVGAAAFIAFYLRRHERTAVEPGSEGFKADSYVYIESIETAGGDGAVADKESWCAENSAVRRVPPEVLFQKAEETLLNPVKRTVYVPKEYIGADMLVSGYSALAEYSMLSAPAVECYATDKISQWKNVMTNRLQDSKTQVAVEMWRYDPRILATGHSVDALSLALTLKDDTDERVEQAVEELLSEVWRKIDGRKI